MAGNILKPKKTSYPLAILLSTLSTFLPFGGVYYLIYTLTHMEKPLTESGDIPVFPVIVAIVTVLQWLILRQPLKNMYQQAVQDNEYDEFGVSKKKSYQNLTRKEREQMDLQKMADMERLLSSSVLKKIVKKGSENPDEELDSMIGI